MWTCTCLEPLTLAIPLCLSRLHENRKPRTKNWLVPRSFKKNPNLHRPAPLVRARSSPHPKIPPSLINQKDISQSVILSLSRSPVSRRPLQIPSIAVIPSATPTPPFSSHRHFCLLLPTSSGAGADSPRLDAFPATSSGTSTWLAFAVGR